MSPLARARALPDAIRVLRISGDLSTPEGRAHERHRRALFATLLALIAKSGSIGTMLIALPIALGYLDTDRYGMRMILSSMVMVLLSAYLGSATAYATQ